ncbi:minor capsid protein, partial [uncultured Fusobacterium sp.]|uniref:minor capsid protein n=1 Tax=uncultured Fusobacterium sp. TaxID=159267 RepID=UPI002597F9AA
NTLHTGLTQSLIRGGNLDDVVNDISQFVNSKIKNKKYVASRLVTTESAAYASKAQEQAYKDLSVDKYEILATLDLHTSDICQDLDGKIFDRKDYQVGVTAPPFHPNCYDKETEILTNQGWKLFRDLTKKDLVYTLNKDTLIPEWQKPINYIFYNYKGKLLHYKNSRFDLMITPEHKIMVQNMDSSVKDKTWKLKSAIAVGRKSKNRMLSGISWKGTNKKFETLANKNVPIEIYLKFMAYWLADGSCTKDRSSYSVKISQYENDWMYEELKDFPFKIYKCKESLMIHNKELGIELSKFGKCTEKYIPENIKELSPELIRIFLMAYAKTDGHIKKGKEWKGYQFDDSIVFFTTSDKLASDLGELILKAGGRPSYYLNKIQGKEIEFKNGKYTINKDCWVISWNKQIHTWLSNLEITEINYDDVVYCVEVSKYNTLLVRRNGKVCWSGNCRTTTVPWFPDDVDTGERAARGKDGKVGYVPQNMTYKEWYNKYVEQKFEESGIIELDNNSSNSVIKRCIEKEIEYIGIEKSSAIPLEEVIISELGGGDKTRGSCSSLAFAYAGNKNGYKVLDFRGGNSQAVFARNKTILEITELEGIRSWVVYEKNDFTALKKLITNMEEKKEYYLAIGRHAAIIRKIEKRYEYLELQSAKYNGFKTLDVGVLKNRFGCQKSYRRAGMTIAPPSMLIDIDTLKGNKEFNQILGFINTAKEKQLKGVEGYEK